MHCRVHRPLRVLTCVANDLLVWKHSLVAHAGATFTIWHDQFCAVLILRHCWRLHTRLGCCHCCGWTRIGRRGITTSVRGRGANHLTVTMTLEGPLTEPGNHFAGQVHLELVVVSLLKNLEGRSTQSCWMVVGSVQSSLQLLDVIRVKCFTVKSL